MGVVFLFSLVTTFTGTSVSTTGLLEFTAVLCFLYFHMDFLFVLVSCYLYFTCFVLLSTVEGPLPNNNDGLFLLKLLFMVVSLTRFACLLKKKSTYFDGLFLYILQPFNVVAQHIFIILPVYHTRDQPVGCCNQIG